MTAPAIGFPIGVTPPPTASQALAPAPLPNDFEDTIQAFVAREDATARRFLAGRDPDIGHVATTADEAIAGTRAEFETFLSDLAEAAKPYAPTADERLEMAHGHALEGTAEHAAIQARIAKRGRVPAESVARLRGEAEETFRQKIDAVIQPLLARLDAAEARAVTFAATDAPTEADARVAAEVRRQLHDLLPQDFVSILGNVIRDVSKSGGNGAGALRLLLPDLRSAYHRPGSPYEKSGDLAMLVLAIDRVLGAPWGPKAAAGRRAEIGALRSRLHQLARAASQADGRSLYEMVREQFRAFAAGYAT